MPAGGKRNRKAVKWGLRVIIFLMLLSGLYLTALAYPQILIHNHVTAGNVSFYYDNANKSEMTELASEVENRIKANDFYDSTKHYKVFYFQNPKTYRFYSSLARIPKTAQGFALSIFGNAFVSATQVHELGILHNNRPIYSIYAGDFAHTIAHEIGHLIITDRIGRNRWRSLPHWKQEGFPEYIANIVSINQDTSTSLPDRVDILQDDFYWGAEYGWDRIHYKAGLLVEFLLDIKAYTLQDIISDSVTHDNVFSEMIEWRKKTSN